MSGVKCFFNGEIQEVSLGLVGNPGVNVAGVTSEPYGLVGKPGVNFE